MVMFGFYNLVQDCRLLGMSVTVQLSLAAKDSYSHAVHQLSCLVRILGILLSRLFD